MNLLSFLKERKSLLIKLSLISLIIISIINLYGQLNKKISFEIKTSSQGNVQIFWDKNGSFSEKNSKKKLISKNNNFQITFDLPFGYSGPLRIDPIDNDGSIQISSIFIQSAYSKKLIEVNFNSVVIESRKKNIDSINGYSYFDSLAGDDDPKLLIENNIIKKIYPIKLITEISIDCFFIITLLIIILYFFYSLNFDLKNNFEKIKNKIYLYLDKIKYSLKKILKKFKYRYIFLIFSLIYLNLVAGSPVALLPGAMHDDGLFLKLGSEIAKFKWLGNYDSLTLSKGPGFPIFLAISHYSALPVTISMGLLYIFSCMIFCRALKNYFPNKLFIFLLFLLILFHPALIPYRVIRDMIYPALTLILLTFSLDLCYYKTISLKNIFFFSIGLSSFWITREEGMWIFPGIVFLIISFVILNRNNSILIKCFFKSLTSVLILTLGFIFIIKFINFYKYGTFELIDFKGSSFSTAVKKLSSVEVGERIPFLPVSEKTRAEIYKYSPTFSKLSSFFEDSGKGWTIHGCNFYPETCGDYAYGWFIWALRDGVSRLGYYQSAKDANNFYDKLSNEITVACDSGFLKCNENPLPFMPMISASQVSNFLPKLYESINISLLKSGVGIFEASHGDPISIYQALNFYRFPKSSRTQEQNVKIISGWFYSKSKTWISISCGDESEKYPVQRLPSKDLTFFLKDQEAKMNRFSIQTLPTEICYLNIDNQKILINSLDQKIYNLGVNFLSIDSIRSFKNEHETGALKIKGFLIKFYSFVLTPLIICGFICYFLSLIIIFIINKKGNIYLVVVSFFWILYITRLILLTLVDISSFPAVFGLYISSSFPLLIIAALSSFYMFFHLIKNSYFQKG